MQKSEKNGKGGSSWLVWTIFLGICGFVFWGMLMPHSCGHGDKARRINCAGNLKQIGLAIIIYAGDDMDEGYLPDGETFARLNEGGYLKDGKVYCCPKRLADEYEARTRAGDSDYVYLGEGVRDVEPRQTTLIIAHDRLENHNGWVNCLYLDGHVKGSSTKAATWHAFRKEREAAGDHFANRPPWAGLPPTQEKER